MTFTAPPKDRYFEDYVPGAVHELGSITIGEADIIEFTWRFEPQPFHMDSEAAKRSVFDGLITSSWDSVSLTMRLLVDHSVSRAAVLGSPGVDEVRLRKPVRPGNSLSVRVTVPECKLSHRNLVKRQPGRTWRY
jgi:acyl dehydratase